MKILIFTEGTILMHKTALGVSRDEAVRQVKEKEASVKEYCSYIPIGKAAMVIQRWKNEAHIISYITSRRDGGESEIIRNVLKKHHFPNSENLFFRMTDESYADVVERVQPNILIEDNCESSDGPKDMISPYLKLATRKNVHQVIVKEFEGIDHLPCDIASYAKKRIIHVDPLSSIPVSLDTYLNDLPVGNGTGFMVRKEEVLYLITNWHVVTGRNINTKQKLSKTSGKVDPNTIHIWRRRNIDTGVTWEVQEEKLRDADNKPLWYEHPTLSNVDVVALRINDDKNFRNSAFELDLNLSEADLVIYPSEPVSIIGFPDGRAVSALWPIWKTGHIASDIDIDFNDGEQDIPVFLIDATTRPGMSGSPVIAKRIGPYSSKWFGVVMNFGQINRFMGIYSGRINEESNIGMVWKPGVIDQIIDSANKE